ncbi:MAG: ABC transporter ATP-binding protein [Pyrobaculum sp.]
MEIRLEEIRKVFSDGTQALRGVTLSIYPREVVALLGENGAGKTTLMKILAGIYRPTSGRVYIGGRLATIRNAREAARLGIAMVHQHPSVIPGLTAMENIVLAVGPTAGGVEEKAVKIAEELGFEINWGRDVEELPLAMRQRVEIVKALCWGARVLILDEPTAVLSPPEVRALFHVVRRLKEGGRAVVYITHKIPEVLEVADRAVVLRRGVKVAEFSPPFNVNNLVDAMVGEVKVGRVEKVGKPAGRPALEIRDLWVYEHRRAVVHGVSLNVSEREILAIVGVEGNGQEELVEAVVGVRRGRGMVKIYGSYAYIPDDRHRKALLTELTLMENAILGMEGRFAKFGIISWREVGRFTERIIDEFHIVAPGPRALARQLSGGNQQKLVVGREMWRGAQLIIAHQPTRGLDVATTEYVHQQLIRARNSGVGVLLVTSDLDEAYKLADSIAVMYRGRITAYGPVEEMPLDLVGRKMAGL